MGPSSRRIRVSPTLTVRGQSHRVIFYSEVVHVGVKHGHRHAQTKPIVSSRFGSRRRDARRIAFTQPLNTDVRSEQVRGGSESRVWQILRNNDGDRFWHRGGYFRL